MMLGPAERLVKHSSLQAWGEGRMVSVSPGSKFASHPNMAPASAKQRAHTLRDLGDRVAPMPSPCIEMEYPCPGRRRQATLRNWEPSL